MGLNIKYFRQTAGLTQKQLADKIDTTWEMVSRYETGKSSPLRRAQAIADALHITLDTLFAESTISEKPSGYRTNSVPLLEKTFSNITSALQSTKIYYTAPDWIVGTYTKPFAISSDIVKIETSQISENGILFVIRDKPSFSKDIAIIQKGNDIAVTQFSSAHASYKTIGTVVAFEKRFR